MILIPRILVFLMAAAMTMSPSWGDLRENDHDVAENEHLHAHYHAHDGESHTHGHHHHENEETNESEHHHKLSDQLPDGVKMIWKAPRRTVVNSPPMVLVPLLHSLPHSSDWDRFTRGKPPSQSSRLHHLPQHIKTVILLV